MTQIFVIYLERLFTSVKNFSRSPGRPKIRMICYNISVVKRYKHILAWEFPKSNGLRTIK